MITRFLNFTDKAEADAALAAVGLAAVVDGEIVYHSQINVLGAFTEIVRNPDGSPVPTVPDDPESPPQTKTNVGYAVNVPETYWHDDLAPHEVTPATPYCVFAGHFEALAAQQPVEEPPAE